MPFNVPASRKPRLVIVGAGFSGFALAHKLKGKDFQIVLIDRNNYHQFLPLCYQVAMSGLEPSSICFPLRKNFQSDREFFVRVAEVNSIDTVQKQIVADIGSLSYDILVLAMGTTTNYYRNERFEKFSIPLKTVSEALYLRNAILSDLEKAIMEHNAERRDKLLDIAIVGGGPTGVELAGALAEMRRHILPKDYPDLDISTMDIHLIQGDSRLLSSMSEKASAKAFDYLQKLGVFVHLNSRVVDLDPDGVLLADGTSIRVGKVIWTAGVYAAAIRGLPDHPPCPGGRIPVNEYLEFTQAPNVYIIGDLAYCACDSFPNGHPQVAPVALQMADQLAANLIALQKSQPIQPFRYTDKGSLATIGRSKAVMDYGNIFFSGFFAWLAWLFVHIYYLIGVRNKIIVFVNWMWNYIFYDQALRLLIRPIHKSPPNP